MSIAEAEELERRAISLHEKAYALRKESRALAERARALREAADGIAAGAAAGIAVGDLVRLTIGCSTAARGTVGKVVDIKPIITSREDRPWVYAVFPKKDGEWGARAVLIYGDWEKVEATEEATS
jgi:hypothetical protein